jgi:hypothetical protein
MFSKRYLFSDSPVRRNVNWESQSFMQKYCGIDALQTHRRQKENDFSSVATAMYCQVKQAYQLQNYTNRPVYVYI